MVSPSQQYQLTSAFSSFVKGFLPKIVNMLIMHEPQNDFLLLVVTNSLSIQISFLIQQVTVHKFL